MAWQNKGCEPRRLNLYDARGESTVQLLRNKTNRLNCFWTIFGNLFESFCLHELFNHIEFFTEIQLEINFKICYYHPHKFYG